MATSGAIFRADAALRLYPSGQRPAPAGGSRAFALAAALLLHAAVVTFIVAEARLSPPPAPTSEPIPVQIVLEPPPPPPPPEAEQEPTPTPPLDEKQANDAPRQANAEKTERDAPDAKSSAPPTPAPSAPPALAPKPAPEAAAETPRRDATATPDAAAEPLPQAPDGEAAKPPQDAAPPRDEPPAKPAAQPAQSTIATFAGLPFPKWETGQKTASLDPLPEFNLGGASGPTPVAGGQSKATYLSILYGLIIAKLNKPGPGARKPETEGAIDFVIDAHGRLVNRRVLRSSGSSELDAAAYEAVAAASPYPAPPTHGAISLKFTYGPK